MSKKTTKKKTAARDTGVPQRPEKPSAALTDKQTRFVAEFLIDLNAAAAARRAGYSAKTADQQGYENLRKPEIATAITAGKTRQLDTAELSAVRVLEELRRLAFVDLRGFYDDAGNLKAISALTAEQGAALAGVEIVKKNLTAGDGFVDTVHKIKRWDKVRTLEILAKHFHLIDEKIKVEFAVEDLAERLHAGQRRNAARK